VKNLPLSKLAVSQASSSLNCQPQATVSTQARRRVLPWCLRVAGALPGADQDVERLEAVALGGRLRLGFLIFLGLVARHE